MGMKIHRNIYSKKKDIKNEPSTYARRLFFKVQM